MTVPANEGENGSPVSLTKLTQGVARSLSGGAAVRTRKDNTPTCRCETRREVPAGGSDFGGHGRRLCYLRIR